MRYYRIFIEQGFWDVEHSHHRKWLEREQEKVSQRFKEDHHSFYQGSFVLHGFNGRFIGAANATYIFETDDGITKNMLMTAQARTIIQVAIQNSTYN